jgi:hypothetical protein
MTGDVLFESEHATRLVEWKGQRLPDRFDPIAILLTEARNRDMQVFAVFSLFSAGHMYERKGTIYTQNPGWQSQVYVVENEEDKIVDISSWAYGTTGYTNPFSTAVRSNQKAILREFMGKYVVDGIILDHARFYGLEADFSEDAKKAFEGYLSTTIDWWPNNVYQIQYNNDNWEIVPGQYFQSWIVFRALTMQGIISEIVDTVHEVDRTMPVGAFVGGWYPNYYEFGLNWASTGYQPDYDWAADDYSETGVAELLNYLVVGYFFPRVKISEAESSGAQWWMSVEGSAQNSKEVVGNACPIYGSILVEQYSKTPEKLEQALKVAVEESNGLYIHDFGFVDTYDYWDEISKIIVVKE